MKIKFNVYKVPNIVTDSNMPDKCLPLLLDSIKLFNIYLQNQKLQ